MFTTETLSFFILNIKTGEFNVSYLFQANKEVPFTLLLLCHFSFSMER